MASGFQHTMKLFFDKGTILIKNSSSVHIPNVKFDKSTKGIRAYGMHYSEIITHLKRSNQNFTDYVEDIIPAPVFKTRDLQLRDYQQQAIQNWKESDMRGCVVLPTGAGKTILGMEAIQTVSSAALVVVPTIDLMKQWADSISRNITVKGEEHEDVTIGMLGGGNDMIRPITVSTYDSAYIRAPLIGNRFRLIIFDEVHHLPAAGYRSIAEQFTAPYRLGLTATIEREDSLHQTIPYLAGKVVFRLGAQKLSEQRHLARYTVDRIQVNLEPDEMTEYEQKYAMFLDGIKKLGFRNPSMHNLRQIIMMSNKNKTARAAMLARNRANEIALNSKAKVNALQEILQKNRHSKTIIFTQNNKMVYDLSDRFLIPHITHKTSREERQDVLEGFRTGRYKAVVTSRVLDEGIDVPDAELGIIMSGTGSGREIIQRLGRILRPKKDGKNARLVEIVSRHTRETITSAKRASVLKRNSGMGENPAWTAKQQTQNKDINT